MEAATPVCINHLYYYQCLQKNTQHMNGDLLYKADSLALLSNHKVSFNNRPPQGEWQFGANRSVLYVTFNWQGAHKQQHVHQFVAIEDTTVFVLVQRGRQFRGDVVLVPRFLPPRFERSFANQPSEHGATGERAPKRQRTSKSRLAS